MVYRTCPSDPNSFANTDQAIIKHSHLSWNVDMTNHIITGNVVHTIMGVSKEGTHSVYLDSRNLVIHKIYQEEKELKFELSAEHKVYGAGIHVKLDSKLMHGDEIKLKIEYETCPDSSALQWLLPEQTVGKIHKYMFSQCQAIHCRSLLPCQDTPGVKITFSANVKAPKPLTVLMSAVSTGENEMGFNFVQKVAVPSYLIAIAVGNLQGIRVGPRTTVWSEPEIVKQAAWEFEETEQFIKIGESLLTPYEWGVYDLLLLPSSFPYGGMENPCLTFVTPTLLAGDRSLVNVVAHEIAHSWMGNLVTTKNWEHFWLNEGFTVFIERKITAKRGGGEPERHFNAIQGLEHLKDSVELFESAGTPQYSCLCPNLSDTDPDDVFSSVPYEKGFNLLFYLETILGGPLVFEPYLKAHVAEFSHKSITTEQFKTFLYEFFSDKKDILDSVDWDAWFNRPGMPPVENNFDATLSDDCKKLSEIWEHCRESLANAPKINVLFDKFNTNQKILFLDNLNSCEPFSVPILEEMDKVYGFSKSNNAEIKSNWFLLCLKANHTEAFPEVVKFVTSVGRMKFVRPIYRALFKASETVAKKAFLEHRSFYHPICAAMVAKDLNLQ